MAVPGSLLEWPIPVGYLTQSHPSQNARRTGHPRICWPFKLGISSACSPLLWRAVKIHFHPADLLALPTHCNTMLIASVLNAGEKCRLEEKLYSALSVSAGSILAMRSAGKRLATAAIDSNSRGTLTSVTRSYVLTP
jgi:hypothetical protein